uniref:Uncharacterized protein n=1 Tax=Lepeophtheirus salmonis TaxID=72036 RepID=A0A0K2V3C4_LEPSM
MSGVFIMSYFQLLTNICTFLKDASLIMSSYCLIPVCFYCHYWDYILPLYMVKCSPSLKAAHALTHS